jgi:membrane protease YdiL (CAAX protease family)
MELRTAGLFEESLLRGYLQSTLSRGIGFWWAALALSFGFGASHLPNRGESPIGILSVVGIGMVFCLSLWLTKSRAPPGDPVSPVLEAK